MTDKLRDQIASRLRLAREASGLTQGQVAKKMEMHRPTLSEIEAGRRRVSADELTKLAQIYGVSVEWFTSDHTSSSRPEDDRILLAARQLSKLKDEDLNRLMGLISMLRQSKEEER